MAKSIQVGDEIEALCNKCKSPTVHVVQTVKEDTVIRVMCKSCLSSHRYRVAEKPSVKPSRVKAERKVLDDTTKQSRKWSRLMAKAETDSPRAYQMSDTYLQNDLIHHEKFGDGIVVSVIDPTKISVVFEEGPKTLIHNRG